MTSGEMQPSEPMVEPTERYERGLALKKAGLYKAAIEQFEHALPDAHLTLKAQAQIGMCFKCAGRHDDAVKAFQKALAAATGSPKETVQILYVLGRTLESLGRRAETLEAYRWIRREDPEYRDVSVRIERLSARQSGTSRKSLTRPGWIDGVLKSWHGFSRQQK